MREPTVPRPQPAPTTPAPVRPVVPRDAAALLGALQADPRPRLTWYGPDGARVELTGRVLVTWVAKTAHLLQEEADVAPGSTVLVRLDADWRGPVVVLATLHLGAAATTDGDGEGDVGVEVVPQDGTATAPGAVLVVVPRSPLPGSLAGLPAGAVDYGAEVSAQPDVLPAPGPASPLPASPPADVGPDPVEASGRVLLGPGTDVATVLGVWAAGGSVVLHTGLAESVLDRVRAQENVTTG